MEAWAGEKFVAGTAEETMLQNATALGGVRVLDQLINELADAGKEGEMENGN